MEYIHSVTPSTKGTFYPHPGNQSSPRAVITMCTRQCGEETLSITRVPSVTLDKCSQSLLQELFFLSMRIWGRIILPNCEEFMSVSSLPPLYPWSQGRLSKVLTSLTRTEEAQYPGLCITHTYFHNNISNNNDTQHSAEVNKGRAQGDRLLGERTHKQPRILHFFLTIPVFQGKRASEFFGNSK